MKRGKQSRGLEILVRVGQLVVGVCKIDDHIFRINDGSFSFLPYELKFPFLPRLEKTLVI